ncbi:MAG: TerC/Alx family metal homeostasis membrane protein [Thermoproteota archaeon]
MQGRYLLLPLLADESLMWVLFGLFVGVALAIDLGAFRPLVKRLRPGRTPAAQSEEEGGDEEHIRQSAFRQGLTWTIVWIGLAAVFAFIIFAQMGYDKMLEFVTGYAVEKSLSVDNMFVFLLIFSSLGVPHALQHRVLSVGILSAIAMRIPLIIVGVSLLENFHWMIYVFGGLLILTAARMIVQKKEKKIEIEKNIAVRLLKKVMPVSTELHGNKFLATVNGVIYATPLLVALAIVEMTDLVFAIDSIPAVLAITTDQFIVITSNIFAILGLRSLYFLLAGVMEKFHYLKPALVALLLFIGVKMVASDVFHLPVQASLAIIGAILGGALVLSVARARREQLAAAHHHHHHHHRSGHSHDGGSGSSRQEN